MEGPKNMILEGRLYQDKFQDWRGNGLKNFRQRGFGF